MIGVARALILIGVVAYAFGWLAFSVAPVAFAAQFFMIAATATLVGTAVSATTARAQ